MFFFVKVMGTVNAAHGHVKNERNTSSGYTLGFVWLFTFGRNVFCKSTTMRKFSSINHHDNRVMGSESEATAQLIEIK